MVPPPFAHYAEGFDRRYRSVVGDVVLLYAVGVVARGHLEATAEVMV